MGQLRNKCVLELPSEAATNWTVWVTNSSHWFYVNGEPELCGNASGARSVGVGGAMREGLYQFKGQKSGFDVRFKVGER